MTYYKPTIMSVEDLCDLYELIAMTGPDAWKLNKKIEVIGDEETYPVTVRGV